MSSFDSDADSTLGQLAYGALFAIVLPVALMFWARALDQRLTLPPAGSPSSGIALAILGALVIVAAVIALRVKGGGWPMSPYPPRTFVTSGIYALVAHPLYFGSVLMMLGVSIALQSGAGVWIVTPVLAACCIAFVWGFENERTLARFGARAQAPLLHLPERSDAAPLLADRVSVCFLALLPWFVVYEAVNRAVSPDDAVSLLLAWETRLPVLPWTELVYFLAYPIVIVAPFVARSRAALRALTIRSWVATAGCALIYLCLPTAFEPRPVPASTFALLLEWERSFDARSTAFPAFHVIWVILTWDIYRVKGKSLVVLAIAASCVTTGMHAIADVVAGLLLGFVFLRIERVWHVLLRAAELLSNAFAEARIGALRIINYGVFAGAAVTIGIVVATSLAGEPYRGAVVAIAGAIIAGAALWAQWVEGSPALLRPYGYYGGIVGGALAITIASLINHSGLLLLAAYAVAATVIQAVGRLRCLVQGCCHGRPTRDDLGIRVTHVKSRVVRIAGLSGVPLHPTALYSTVTNLVFFSMLLRMWIAGAPLAFIAGSYFILSGLARFVEEHYRGEPQTRIVAGMRFYQWLAIGSVVIGAVLTTLPSPAAPPASAVSLTTLLTALAFGVVATAAYGADFPESNARFARLA